MTTSLGRIWVIACYVSIALTLLFFLLLLVQMFFGF